MNPLKWKREHQVALLGAALIGAIIGPLVGYALIRDDFSFEFWFWRSRSLAWAWIAGGAITSAAAVYVLRLARV